jgi:hypothetical protein
MRKLEEMYNYKPRDFVQHAKHESLSYQRGGDIRCTLHTWGEEKCVRNSGGDTEEKRRLGGPRRREEDNIERDIKETGRETVDWIHQIYERDKRRVAVNAVMKI